MVVKHSCSASMTAQIKNTVAVLVSVVALPFTGTLNAQTLPNSVNPAQIQKELEQPIDLAVPPPLSLPPKPSLIRPANIEQIKFELVNIEILGAKNVDVEDLKQVFIGKIGTTVSLVNIYDIADKLTALYRSRGYVLSQAVIPAQRIDDGRVKIQIVEGFIGNAVVDGINADGTETIDKLSTGFILQKPMRLDTFERSLLLINDLPGINAAAVIGKSNDGGLGSAGVRLAVNHDLWSGSVSFNNRGSGQLGPGRIQIAGTRNLLALQHTQLSANGAFALGKGELSVVSGSVETGLKNGHSRIKVSASVVGASPDVQIEAFDDFETKSVSFGLSLTSPLHRSRYNNVYIDLGFDAFDTSSLGQQAEGGFGTDTKTKTRDLSLGVNVDLVNHGRDVNQMEFRIVTGLAGLGASDSRLQGNSPELSYRKVEYSASRLNSLPFGFSLLTAIKGQIAVTNNLPPSEAFSIGGQSFVRAYDGSERSGDEGLAAKLELRYNGSYNNFSLNPYGFYDVGRVDQSKNLAALGVGIRLSKSGIGGYGELVLPLDGAVAAEGNDDPRFFGGISYSF